jgi:K(+)-stimulated pyrophosphate-energized sodium pump
MNILIKLMSIVSLVIAPTLAGVWGTENNSENGAAKINTQQSLPVIKTTTKNPNTVQLR